MALTLALPLFGLDPAHFSALNTKLLNIEHEQNNSSDSGRISPSSKSDSSGISSLATSAELASVAITPISSRPETPIRLPCKSQEKIIVPPVRIVYEGRDILNLGANIRSSYDWQMRDRTMSRHNIQDFINNRLIHHRLREQPPTKDCNLAKRCHECEFYEPPSIF